MNVCMYVLGSEGVRRGREEGEVGGKGGNRREKGEWNLWVCFSHIRALRDGIDVSPAGAKARVHIGHLALYQLEFADALPKLLAGVDILQSVPRAQ